MATIAMIPVDSSGNKLFIKDLRVDEKQRTFIKYKSTYNDMPFMEVELYGVDNGKNCAICGDDGTILYLFSTAWLSSLNSA